MNLAAAEQMAQQIVREYLGGSWRFAWNRRKRCFGVCHYGKRTIELSRILTETEPEHKVRDTVLHEVAHAIAGAAAGHGPQWKAQARKLGATP